MAKQAPERPVRRSASVKDVAATAGVSLGTVSNVLNRPERVSASTRARVEQTMVALGFVRNESARQLRMGRSNSIAYVMLDGANPFFNDVAQGIEDAASAGGLSVFLCNSNNDAEREAVYLKRLEAQRVDGILITPVDPASETLGALAARGTPLVIVDRRRDGESHCSVSVDDVLGGRLAGHHLIDQGHRRIAFVGGPTTIGQVRERRQGLEQTINNTASAHPTLVDIPTTALTVAQGREAGERLAGLPANTRPTAAFCANDLVALGLLQTCAALGIAVPGDMAIVGYDDIIFAAAAATPLTSVRQPRTELGRKATELLVDEASSIDHVHEQVLFEPELVVRGSTRNV